MSEIRPGPVPAAPDNLPPTAHLTCVHCRKADGERARVGLCGEALMGIPAANDIPICGNCLEVMDAVALGRRPLPCGHMRDGSPAPQHPLPRGTRVWHHGQRWAASLPGGTAVVLEADGPYNDGTWEYEVQACADFARRPGADNLMNRRVRWPGWALRLPPQR